jgi:UDP-N-acetyl-alpha-D-muramoyl-L-alanyl-L-glutamate epimerase
MAHRFTELRQAHPTFVYERAESRETEDGLRLEFGFRLGEVRFVPTHFIPKPAAGWAIDPAGPLVRRLVFSIGMVELISYWKAACPPRVIIETGSLSTEEIAWWRKLYYLGLGEFFYTNGITISEEDFLRLEAPHAGPPQPLRIERSAAAGTLIPIGGGKDSVVSMELLPERRTIYCSSMLPPPG